jgi:glycine cleavage system H lipoate-binding protein
MDEFASKLIGKIDSIKLPLRNTWVQQGHKFATIVRGGKTVTLFSPVEGVVADVNDAVILNPEAARKQPYGDGWLIMVQTPDQKSNFRNLFTGGLAKRWMEDIVSRLNPIMAQDGGEAVDDFAMASGRDWEAAIKEFLLN